LSVLIGGHCASFLILRFVRLAETRGAQAFVQDGLRQRQLSSASVDVPSFRYLGSRNRHADVLDGQA
jgi:hypothetical protein